ncbi:hypothetical protein [Ruania albidiflava]|uniref:hypothetical protein n=1 Tax=Ruania albidiflava TaxID=366586 RepID=UPI0023F474C1|nr:hypothetical protein [Ruania albidiflava]
MTTATVQRCARCGIGEDGLIHHATANGHPFTTEAELLTYGHPGEDGDIEHLLAPAWDDVLAGGATR